MTEQSIPQDYVPFDGAVRQLLAQANLAQEFKSSPVSGGANNRTFRIDTADGPALLKWYFADPAQSGDRLQTEFTFSSFAWNHQIHFVPQPLACTRSLRLALYEFIEGRRPTSEDVTPERLSQAVEFFRLLVRSRAAPEASALASAAEACFSLDEHLNCVLRRVDRVAAIPADTGIDEEARNFVNLQLVPAARTVAGQLRESATRLGLNWNEPLSLADRCISPSDFGFHNALVTPGNGVRFFDFEYAGWDDPAKLICDFFHQVQVPVRREYYDDFAGAICAELPNPEIVCRRADCLMPLYGIKWCCIVLNEFLPAAAARRNFSDDREPLEVRKTRQLQKSREILGRLNLHHAAN